MTVLYFGPDAADPAVMRRVAQWRTAGHDVVPLAFHRGDAPPAAPDFVDLGRIGRAVGPGRILSVLGAILRVARCRGKLPRRGIVVARNLDNLIVALAARRLAGMTAPVVYEVLDVNPACTAQSLSGRLIRALERRALGTVDLLVVSSPEFVDAYYAGRLGRVPPWFLFENRVPRAYAAALRPALGERTERRPGTPWRIGWFGFLDDERSWQLLAALARAMPDRVVVEVRGLPYTNFDMERFRREAALLPNVRYGGGYRNPDDLGAMMRSVDLVWSIDCNHLEGNSAWLLTNSLYEAGFHGVPLIALAGTAVGKLVAAEGIGFLLDAPTEAALVSLVDGLAEDVYAERRARLAALGPERFAESDEIERVMTLVAARSAREERLLPGAPNTPIAQ